MPEEIPTETDTTYLTEASSAQSADQATSAAGGNAEESIVVFCIDTSGSMCVTTEVREFNVVLILCSLIIHKFFT